MFFVFLPFLVYNNGWISENTSVLGGAGYILPSSTISYSSSSIPLFSSLYAQGNRAHYGAVFCFESTVYPPNYEPPTVFVENVAEKMGGVIFVNSYHFSANDSKQSWLPNAYFYNKLVWFLLLFYFLAFFHFLIYFLSFYLAQACGLVLRWRGKQ